MYNYEEQKPRLFTDDGQRMLLQIRDRINKHLDNAGACRMQEAISGTCGDSWMMLACVDRMAELGEIYELAYPQKVAGQHRVFVRALRYE